MAFLHAEFRISYESLPRADKIHLCLELLRAVPQKKILVDGVAAAGKGTLSQKIVDDLGLEKINSGDIYRTITLHLLQKGLTQESVAQMSDEELRGQLADIVINSATLGAQQLHSQQVDQNISAIVKRNPVRDLVEEYQRHVVAENDGVFIEGRDLWIVFRNVPGVILIYLYATDAELVRREIVRQRQLGREITEAEAKKRIIDRNVADNNRSRGQLLLPQQAEAGLGNYQLVINTTGLVPDDVYLAVLEKLCKELVR